jgi:hypothetical protein
MSGTSSGGGQAGSSGDQPSGGRPVPQPASGGGPTPVQQLAGHGDWLAVALGCLEARMEAEKLPGFPWRNILNGHNTNRPFL